MNSQLNIITAVSRPQNLIRIAESIEPIRQRMPVHWYCILDGTKCCYDDVGSMVHAHLHCLDSVDESGGGGPQKSRGLDLVRDGLVWFLDDDNLVHPAFPSTLDDAVMYDPDIIVISQCIADGTPRLKAESLEHGRIDTAMFVVKRDVIGDVRWDSDYSADFRFINSISRGRSVKYIDIVACYYNAIGDGYAKEPPP